MKENKSNFSISPIVVNLGGFFLVSISTFIAWLATPTGDVVIQIKTIAPTATAFMGVLGSWAVWTYRLWRRDSVRERIRDAISKGRLICHCTESGEIMTQHYGVGHGIELLACPRCENINITSPRGEVFIADETEFRPPLPRVAHERWLQRSRAQR